MRDYDVREALRERLRSEHAGDSNTRVVEEMGIWSGTVRVDVAVINGELSGYELKSDSDTLERLPYQIEIYGKVFDRVTLVVGRKHAKKAAALIPKWWGYIEAKDNPDGVSLRPKRKGRTNPNRDPSVIAQLLRKQEALAILEGCRLARGWRSKKSSDIVERLVSALSLDDLRFHVREALKGREQLGQVVSRDLDVPIQIQADPHARIARGQRLSDGVDLAVRPAMRQSVPFRPKADYLIGIPPELLVHGHSAWTFDLDAPEDHELIRESVFSIDGSKKVDIDRGPWSDAAVVSEVETVRQRATRNLLPQRQLPTVNSGCAKIVASKCLRDAASKQGNAAPLAPSVKRCKRVRHRDAKGRYVRYAAA